MRFSPGAEGEWGGGSGGYSDLRLRVSSQSHFPSPIPHPPLPFPSSTSPPPFSVFLRSSVLFREFERADMVFGIPQVDPRVFIFRFRDSK